MYTDETLNRRILGVGTDQLALAAAVVILCVSLLPASQAVGVASSDTINHMLAYGVLTFLALIRRSTFAAIAITLMAITVFGAAVEAIQPIFGRKAELTDFAANLTGETIGVSLAMMLRFFSKQPRP